jgi:hypothetical protein
MCMHALLGPFFFIYICLYHYAQHIPWRRLSSCAIASASSSTAASIALELPRRYAMQRLHIAGRCVTSYIWWEIHGMECS